MTTMWSTLSSGVVLALGRAAPAKTAAPARSTTATPASATGLNRFCIKFPPLCRTARFSCIPADGARGTCDTYPWAIRICLVTPFAWSQPHDVNEHVAGVAGALRSLGHEVTVLAPSTRGGDLLAGRRALAKREHADVIAV